MQGRPSLTIAFIHVTSNMDATYGITTTTGDFKSKQIYKNSIRGKY